MTKEERNELTREILDSSIRVHKGLGPGLLEVVYEVCLCKELTKKGIKYKRQLSLPVIYYGEKLDLNFKIDLLIENEIIIELKAIEKLLPVHQAQLLTYLKLANKRLGLLINFNRETLIKGFSRIINGYD